MAGDENGRGREAVAGAGCTMGGVWGGEAWWHEWIVRDSNFIPVYRGDDYRELRLNRAIMPLPFV